MSASFIVQFPCHRFFLNYGSELPHPIVGVAFPLSIHNFHAMRIIQWLKTAATATQQLQDNTNALKECQHDLDRLSRAIDNLSLDMDSLYDKVKTALGRISQRARRDRQEEPEPDQLKLVDINEQIRNGTFDGGIRS